MYYILRLFNTLKHLKWQQFYFRVKRKLFKPKITDKLTKLPVKRSLTWSHYFLYEEKIDLNLVAKFLNQSKNLSLPNDWNNENLSILWSYNLHYFENLLCKGADKKYDFHLQLLNNWIANNPTGCGIGWQSYPTSLRTVNIIKAWLGGLELDDKIFESVHAQASYLSNDLEKHLLGNHYFVNLKAMLFAGVVFKNTHWIKIGEEGLLSEIPEQILDDGGNFELSPMYHSLILVDMLDLFNLCKSYSSYLSQRLELLLFKYIPKMLNFMESMSHLDGGVSFFNDSVDGIAPLKSDIQSYAKQLGFEVNSFCSLSPQIIDNDCCGYFCAFSAGNKLIFDASAVGPDYIPGHAHADTLSLELSIGHERVLVNSGISEYGLSGKRHTQRRTMSHNTIEVNGIDSSEVWSGFRVGKRARIIERYSELKSNDDIFLKASHNGYNSIINECIHSREICFNNGRLTINDELHGKFKEAKSRFYFHPSLVVSFNRSILLINGRSFSMKCNLKNQNASLLNTFWHPEFGVEVPNKLLVIEINNKKTQICFEWINK
jgi:hypothetical protein